MSKQKSAIKKKQIKVRSIKMSSPAASEKVRLVISCTEEEKMYIKMLAARNKKTVSEYLLDYPRTEMPKCGGRHCALNHEPNKETKRALKESREGKGEIFDSVNDFWKSLGINPNAKT